MAKKPRKSSIETIAEKEVSSQERIARILALNSIVNLAAGDQVVFLRSVGFSILETAQLLRISGNQVSVSMNQAKKRKPSYLTEKKDG